MGIVYRNLATYESLIYVALAIVGMFAFRRMWRAWREWRDSVYGLEREFALRRLGQATAFAFIVLGLVFAEFFIATFVAPALPASDILATPTLNLLASPEGTLSPDAATQAALSPVTQEVPSGMNGCDPDKIMITAPKSGEVIKGTVTLTGTASVPNFGFFKYEFAPLGTANWVTISAGDKIVKNDKLGEWDTTPIANGDYFLQLVIIDNVGITLDPCVIAVRVLNQ
jgi:hypothetical protein